MGERNIGRDGKNMLGKNKTKHLAKDGGKAIQVFVTVILTSALNVHHNQKGSEHL